MCKIKSQSEYELVKKFCKKVLEQEEGKITVDIKDDVILLVASIGNEEKSLRSLSQKEWLFIKALGFVSGNTICQQQSHIIEVWPVNKDRVKKEFEEAKVFFGGEK